MTLHRFHVLESTNLRLMEMADDAPPWTAVMADVQKGGLGRTGRFWWSPPGGLYMSILVRPLPGVHALPRLPILSSLALMDVLDSRADLPLRVKWPNDILVGDRKLAGILIQSRTAGASVPWIVAGFGVNISRPEEPVPPEIGDKITFLEEIDRFRNPHELAESIILRLRARLHSLDDAAWGEACEEWTRRANWNTVYTHREGSRQTRGLPLRLSADGGLVLITGRGEVTVNTGEVLEAV